MPFGGDPVDTVLGLQHAFDVHADLVALWPQQPDHAGHQIGAVHL